jgi:hypothetical protein
VDRQQKIDRIANQSGRVSEVSNLEVNPNSFNQDYKQEQCDGRLTETGNLEVLKLVPISGSGPSFTARWDQKPDHLDIDMHCASNSAISKFRNNKGGYLGHHTRRTTDPDKRIFEVKIKTPAGAIFDGGISFSLTRKIISNEGIRFGEMVHAEVIQNSS